MNINYSQIVGAGLFSLVIFISGFHLSRSGKPYNGIVFNLHKLVALAAVILFVVVLRQANQTNALDAIEWVVGVLGGLFFLALFVTGALVSIDKAMPAVVLKIHHLTPYLALLSTAATLFLLHGRHR